MTVFQKFITGFVQRDGLSVLLSTFFIKISGILLSIFVVRLLSLNEYGNITFGLSVIGILTVFAGIGSNWSLLRFGPQQPSLSAKFQMFKYSVEKGRLYTIPIVLAVIAGSFLLPAKLEGSAHYLIILSFSLLTTLHSQSLESYFRIIQKNKIYSKYNVLGALMLLSLSVALSYVWKGYGYVSAIVLAPLFTYLLFYKHVSYRKLEKANFPAKQFLTYGLYSSLGMIANQVIILLGPIIGGYLNASPEDLALFRVATIIPFNVLIFPMLIMTTDFVHFSKNSKNPSLLKEYYLHYLKTIGAIVIVPFLILIIFHKDFLVLLFGEKYSGSANSLFVLLVGVFFSTLFRIPLGNMLGAVGKADWNVFHTIFWLIAFVPLSILGFHKWGMEGIALTISFIFVCSGFVSLFLFSLYLKQTERKNIETNN